VRWILLVSAALFAVSGARAQVQYARGQDVAPVFEGWERNADGTFNMVFGYLNRNYDEELDIPVGPNNNVDAGPGTSADRGQPTHFYPRRQRFLFRVVVPKDWNKEQKVIWTITSHGKTNQAKGWLQPVWELSEDVIVENMGGGVPDPNNKPPSLTLGDLATVTLPESATLTATATDDGLPKPYRKTPSNPDRDSQPRRPRGVDIKWILYRGPGKVTFDPRTSAVVYGEPVTFASKVSFGAPGTYVLRATAYDGQLSTSRDVTVNASAPIAGTNADDYRGGWRTDKGEPHTYEFSIRGDKVRGIYCTYCADATTLAFVDGKLGPDGLTFVVTHVNADGSTAYQDNATARFDRGNLIVTGTSGGARFERTLIKDPRGPDPLPIIVSVLPKGPPVPAVAINQQGIGAPAPRYIQPGPWKSTLTEKDVIGVWLGFGVGAPKQYFIIRKVGDKLRGMVCGTCDNTYTMAALDDFEIQGDTLKFNILHEDWGDGELPTFYKHVTAHVGWNEMRCTTAVDHQPPPPARPRPPGFVPGFSLTGPIAIEATAGNRWPNWPPQNTSLPHP
jgi:hypothetical protein